MNIYIADHRNFSFHLKLTQHLSKINLPFLICKTNLNSLYASIVYQKKYSSNVEYKPTKLNKTPHYKYINGNTQPYKAYLKKFGNRVGYPDEHTVANFNKLLRNDFSYLKGKFSENYIVCEKIKDTDGFKNVIIDGVHKAVILFNQGIEEIPVAFVLKKPPGKFTQLDQYLNDYKNDFLEWYTPVEIEGRTIHERTYPNFKERPEFFSNRERGKSKWDFIIKKNLPTIKGKTVCDIGCNIGLYSIFMAQMGAKKVDGFDRGENVVQPTNKNLPRQNVVQQAYFVRNLFKLARRKNLDKINYFKCDINKMDFSKLKYDLFFSSCVLYHFGGEKFEEIIKKVSKNIPEIFLQTNLGHGGNLAKLASISYQKNLLEKYGYKVKTDIPKNYYYPILYGKKKIEINKMSIFQKLVNFIINNLIPKRL